MNNIFNRIPNNKGNKGSGALIPLLIAAMGIGVFSGLAQSRVEHTGTHGSVNMPKINTPEEQYSGQSVMVYRSSNNGHEYEIKLVDGEVVMAKRDGEDFDPDLVRLDDGVLLFLDENNQVIHEVKVPRVYRPSDRKLGKYTQNTNERAKQKEDWLVWSDDDSSDLHSSKALDNPSDNRRIFITQTHRPKVMLGINLGEPSDALRKHLGLGKDQRAILVEQVIEGLPADRSGIEDYDVIVSIDDSDQADGVLLSEVLKEKDPGDTIKLVVLRSGDEVKVEVELAKYDPQALGVISSGLDGGQDTGWSMTITPEGDTEVFNFLGELKDIQLSEQLEEKLMQVQERIRQQLLESREQRDLAQQMREKALDAMRDAERQMIEFRDGKLLIRSAHDIEERMDEFFEGQVHDRFERLASTELYEEMEGRLEELEDRFDRQFDALSEQLDDLAEMFDELMEALESDDE